MVKIIETIEAEILASKKEAKTINIQLFLDEGVYKAFTNLKIEGEYILSSASINDCIVHVKKYKNHIVVDGIDSDKEKKINCFLTKDNTTLLSALKSRVRRNNLSSEPFFIVGPPGTGKTKVITKILEGAIKNNQKVLICSPTNMAVGVTC